MQGRPRGPGRGGAAEGLQAGPRGLWRLRRPRGRGKRAGAAPGGARAGLESAAGAHGRVGRGGSRRAGTGCRGDGALLTLGGAGCSVGAAGRLAWGLGGGRRGSGFGAVGCLQRLRLAAACGLGSQCKRWVPAARPTCRLSCGTAGALVVVFSLFSVCNICWGRCQRVLPWAITFLCVFS